jgi:hypothetical protein
MTAAVPDDYGIPLGGPTELQRAWMMMAGGSPEIVAILMGIARNSPNDSTRVAAGLGLLKMGGFGGSDVVPVRIVPQQFDQAAGVGEGKESAAKRLEDRWAKLREADASVDQVVGDDEVIDAVIVDE